VIIEVMGGCGDRLIRLFCRPAKPFQAGFTLLEKKKKKQMLLPCWKNNSGFYDRAI
jgi:hypothetical protein